MILYVTFDGLLQPLGRSQVLRYVEGLSALGRRFTILSLERDEDLADARRVADLEERLRAGGTGWIRGRYRQGGARNVLANVAEATRLALDFAADTDVQLTHARSYVAGGVALALKQVLGVPYLFDIRGYWVDEKIEEGQWFTNAAALRAARAAERRLYRHADAVVSLARPAAQDIERGRFGPWDRPLAVIPTCVDDEEFTMGSPRADLAPELHDRLVVGYIGSLNRSYRYDQSFELFRYLLDQRGDAHLVCLTGQPAQMNEVLDEHRIPAANRTVARVDHDEVADWLRVIDWGLLLLNEPFAKRGSMPTKLGEFLATGVRPLAYGCNEEVVDRVRRAGSGIVLESTTPRALRATASEIARVGKRPRIDDEVGTRARNLTMPHFSARRGVERYDALYTQLLGLNAAL